MATLAREIGRGTASVFLAEALAVPAGLLIAGLLSRSLGPGGYGRYGVAVAIVAAVEWLIAGAYSRISIQLLSEPDQRDRVEPTILRHHLLTALGAMAALMALADVISAVLRAPYLTVDLRWLALDVPLFAMAQAQRSILTARGEYAGRAGAIAARWISRVVATAATLQLGYGVTGALWAWPVASLAELLALRRLSWRRLFDREHAPVGLWRVGWAPLLFTVGQRAIERADLLLLQAFNTPAASLGVYVAAQNLSILPGLFAAALSPILIAAMTRERALGREIASRRTAAAFLRVTLCLTPLAPVFGACGGELAALAFGRPYASAGPLTGWLVAGYIGLALTSAAASILASQGRHLMTALLSVPATACATALHLLVIPRYGPVGAAVVTAMVGLASGVVATAVVFRGWREPFPLATVLRVSAASLAVYALFGSGVLAPFAFPVRLGGLMIVSGAMLLLLREGTIAELRAMLART